MKNGVGVFPKKVGFSNVQRDTYQSNGAGLMSASERVAAEPNVEKVGWSSVQTAGGTFFHKPMMEGRDPWAEIEILSKAYPNIERTMLLRGDTQVAYDIMPDDVIEHNMREHARAGVNVFTIFDGLDDFDNVREPVKWANRLREDEGFETYGQGVICVGQSKAYTMDLYRGLAEKYVEAGVRDLYIKDPCGVVLPDTMNELVSHLKSDFDLPVYMHTHDTHGLAIASYMAGFAAGADNADVAHPAFAGNVGQPSALKLLHAMQTDPSQYVRDRAPDLNVDAIMADCAPMLEMCMRLAEAQPEFDRGVFESLYAALGPGGAASTLKPIMAPNFQAVKGMDWRTAQKEIYAFQSAMLGALGDVLQVTPHAKNTTDTAGFSRFRDANPNETGTWTLSGGTRKLLTGQSGKQPGTPDPELVQRALKEEGMTEVATGRPADKLKPMIEEARALLAAEADKLERKAKNLQSNWVAASTKDLRNSKRKTPGIVAALRNPSMADLVTVAMWNNEKKEGLTHVVKKLSGELQPKASPSFNMEKWARDSKVRIQNLPRLLESAGGAHEIEHVAQAVLELEKVGYYRTGYEGQDNLTAEQMDRHEHMLRVHSDIEQEARGIIQNFFETLPKRQQEAGIKSAKIASGAILRLLETRSAAKGVTADTFEEVKLIRDQVADIFAKVDVDYSGTLQQAAQPPVDAMDFAPVK